MSIQPAPSPFERVPEELLVMIQEEVLIKNEPDEGSEQTADATSNFFHPSRWYREGGFSMLKNLRMACREYTYLPRLLSDLFKTTRLVSTPPNLRLHQMTDLSVFTTYVRRVVSDPRTYASVIGLEIGTAELQSAWTEILLQLSNVGKSYDAVQRLLEIAADIRRCFERAWEHDHSSETSADSLP